MRRSNSSNNNSSTAHRRSASASAVTLKGRGGGRTSNSDGSTTLKLHDVAAVKKKLQLVERKAAEVEQQEEALLADIARQEEALEDLLDRVAGARRDEQEMVLRVVEAKLLQDGLLAQQTEAHRAIANQRRRLFEEHGNSTIKGYTLRNFDVIRQQRQSEVDELTAALDSVLAQTLACDAEIALLEGAVKETEESVAETKELVLDQKAQLGVVVESVANVLGHVDK